LRDFATQAGLIQAG